MVDFLKPLVFILGLSGFAFIATIWPLASMVGRRRIQIWISVWTVMTVCIFLVQDFWLLLPLSGLVLLWARKWESDSAVLFMLVFYMTPTTVFVVPGIGDIQSFVAFTFQDFLAAILLLPILLFGGIEKSKLTNSPRMLLLLFLGFSAILFFRETTSSNALRMALASVFTVFVPFLAFSSCINSSERMRAVVLAMIFASLPLSLIGLYELKYHWYLYQSTFGSWVRAQYMLREGMLRAAGSLLESIPFGSIFMVSIGLWLGFPQRLPKIRTHILVIALLLGGLFSPLARGPWLGTVSIFVIFLLTGRKKVEGFLKFAAIGVICFFLLTMLPIGEQVINLLPYFGSSENMETTDYRVKMFNNALIVIKRNPLFGLGAADVLETPEMREMIQGQGIIDITNTYVGIALRFGLIGLGLFALFFVVVLLGLARGFMSLPETEIELKLMARALFATLCGLLISIFTTASVGHIPYLYWIVAGLCVAQTRIIWTKTNALRSAVKMELSFIAPSSAKPIKRQASGVRPRRSLPKSKIYRG